jgi:hypothetical protein
MWDSEFAGSMEGLVSGDPKFMGSNRGCGLPWMNSPMCVFDMKQIGTCLGVAIPKSEMYLFAGICGLTQAPPPVDSMFRLVHMCMSSCSPLLLRVDNLASFKTASKTDQASTMPLPASLTCNVHDTNKLCSKTAKHSTHVTNDITFPYGLNVLQTNVEDDDFLNQERCATYRTIFGKGQAGLMLLMILQLL